MRAPHLAWAHLPYRRVDIGNLAKSREGQRAAGRGHYKCLPATTSILYCIFDLHFTRFHCTSFPAENTWPLSGPEGEAFLPLQLLLLPVVVFVVAVVAVFGSHTWARGDYQWNASWMSNRGCVIIIAESTLSSISSRPPAKIATACNWQRRSLPAPSRVMRRFASPRRMTAASFFDALSCNFVKNVSNRFRWFIAKFISTL